MYSGFDFNRYGSAYTAMHLHQLRVKVSAQCDDLFLSYGVVSPSHCSSVVLLLAQHESGVGLTEIAARLGYSHQLVNQRLKILEKLSLAHRIADPKDGRKNLAALTKKGHAEAKRIAAVLPVLSDGLDTVFQEIGVDIIDVITAASAALDAQPLLERAAITTRAVSA